MVLLSKLRELLHRNRETRVSIVYVHDSVWGIFTTADKAIKAVADWHLNPIWSPRITSYVLDWRNKKTPPARYLSDSPDDNANPNLGTASGRVEKELPTDSITED